MTSNEQTPSATLPMTRSATTSASMPSGCTPLPPSAEAHVAPAAKGFLSRSSVPPPPAVPEMLAGVVSTSRAESIVAPAGICPDAAPNRPSKRSSATCCWPTAEPDQATAAAAKPPVGRDCASMVSTAPAYPDTPCWNTATFAVGRTQSTSSRGRLSIAVASDDEKAQPSVPAFHGRTAQPLLAAPSAQACTSAVTSSVNPVMTGTSGVRKAVPACATNADAASRPSA